MKVFRRFPIYEASGSQQDILESIVDLITIDKKNNIDTLNLEREIDILVYKLYELTFEDSQIIDPTLIQEEWGKVNFE